MRLFLRDHLSFVLLYLTTFLGLPVIIHLLDGIEGHLSYFMFLAIFLLLVFLVFRYTRRKNMYTHLEEGQVDDADMLIHQPHSPIERAYAAKMQRIQSLFFMKEDKYKDTLSEQQLLISHAVHQMKTPLSVIQLLVQSNQMRELDGHSEWQKVKSECHKLNFSLNQLLTYSRSTKLLADLKIEAIPLKTALKEVVNDLKEYFIEKEVFPKIVIPEDVLLYTDRKWMKVVFYQLLSNAIKYGDKESIILIHFEEDKIRFSNRGEIIPASEINRVYDLFYTGSKGRMKGEATGIGLYLVKNILETLNHPFQLHSANHETTFMIDLSRSIERTLS
ncbi:sensor histidine kinase [Paenibacillus sp. 1001270B_150601_E10]|uniref:sensor histidine kinase n=1 Tax=Paenibacillus sp. 1001270B_150601_E10 TaxID=2787079 RepID=UPI0018A024AB|nr:HAMP domain-containing sensor histidine kinase [Paenibacillus sp. 1001270B_150601_E10]